MKGLIFSFLFFALPLAAAYTQVDGVWCALPYAPVKSASGHFDEANGALQNKEYDEALRNYHIILQHFADTIFYSEALFQSGVCYYHIGHMDLADRQFTRYF